jgi:ABC-type Fe3+/spermidine/putrescine transport system ATPase subunit
MSEDILNVDGVRKTYGDVVAIDDVSIDLEDGEFFTLLGPSGSGKSTLLRIIAGLERPTEGRIRVDDEDVTDLTADKQDTSLIFQDFSLFPHKTVGENIAFPLKMDGVDAAERQQRGEEMLEFVDLEGYYDRYPQELSGGEQQRVALARGLISEPKLLLLDEPLSSLDRKLRQELEVELRKYQRETGITFVYVTHNQEEALVMSDRIAVMRDGNVEQIDTPREIYEQPRSPFVGSFLGESNRFQGTVTAVDDGVAAVESESSRFVAEAVDELSTGDEAELLVKVEDCGLDPDGDDAAAENRLTGTLVDEIFRGTETTFLVDSDDTAEEIVVRNPKDKRVAATTGDRVAVSWEPNDARAFRHGP